MGQALLVPTRKKQSIMSLRPALWLSADSGMGTTGARSLASARMERFQLAQVIAPGLSDFWVSFWIRRENTSAWHGILYLYHATGRFHLMAASGGTGLRFRIGGTTLDFSGALLAALQWQHCAINFDRDGSATLYTNGVQVGSVDISSTASVSVGNADPTQGFLGYEPSGYMDGRLSRMGYGTGLLTDAEVLQLYNQGNGRFYAELPASIESKTVHYWNLNETSLSPAIDAKGTNDGAISGGNLLTNPGFETAGSGGADVFGAWYESASGASTVNDDTTQMRTGAHCCRFDVDGSNSLAGVYQSILTSGRRYTVSGYAKCSSGTPTAKIGMGGTETTLPTLTTSWASFSVTDTAAGATATFYRNSAASVSIYLDDLSVASAQIDSAAGPREATAADLVGGCLTDTTKIHTPIGFVTAKKAFDEKTDSIYSSSGRAQRITGHFERQYDGRVITIQSRGWKTELTPEHKVLVVPRSEMKSWKQRNYTRTYRGMETVPVCDLNPVWVPAGDVVPGDFVVFPLSECSDSPFVWSIRSDGKNGRSSKYNRDILVTEQVAELIGWYVAEGSSHNGHVEWALNDDDDIEWVVKAIEDVFGKTPRVRRRTGFVQIVLCCKPIADALAEACGVGALNKKFPEWILNGSNSVVSAAVRGWLYGDGQQKFVGYRHSDSPLSDGATVSDVLCSQVVHMLAKLDVVPSYYLGNNGHTPFHRIIIRGSQLGRVFREQFDDRSTCVVNAHDKAYAVVTSVSERDYSGTVYDFETEDHSITVPFVIHNSHGVLTNMDPVAAWSTDTPDGSYTASKLDSVGTAHGTMTGFTDIDAAHVDGPDGAWGPAITDRGSSPAQGWLLSSVNDSRSANVPSTLNTRIFDEAYSEPESTGSRSFDGVDQRFGLATSPALGTDSFSIEWWHYSTGNSAIRAPFGLGGTSAGNPGILCYSSASSTNVSVGMADGDSTTPLMYLGVQSAPLYTWTHIALVVDRVANTLYGYVNGSLVATADISSITGSLTPSTNRAIGSYRDAASSYPWVGAISRFRVYLGDALTPAEIAETYNGGKGRTLDELSTALRAKVDHSWALDEAGNSNAIDSVGGNTGTQAGTSTNIASGPSPYLPAFDATLVGFTSSPRSSDVPSVLVGKCKSLQGVTDDYATTGVKTVTGMGARSALVWIKRNGNPSATEYVMTETQVSYANRGLSVYVTSAGNATFAIMDGSGTAPLVSGTFGYVCDGNWHLVALTWNGGTVGGSVKGYLDNVEVFSIAPTGVTQGGASTNSLQLFGFNGATGVEFQGLICRPQIFAGRALTAGEVATLYAGGDVLEGLTAEWRFNEPDSITVPFEHALKCDGANTAVDTGAENVGAGAVTVSGWINYNSTGENGVGRICDNSRFSFNVMLTGALRCSSAGSVLVRTVDNALPGTSQWTHVAVTRDIDGHAEFFVNGMQQAVTTILTANTGVPAAGTSNLTIGNNQALLATFDGLIGQVRIDSGVLTTAQIRQLALGQSPTTPTHEWRFDDALNLPYLTGCKAIRFDGVDDRLLTAVTNVIPVGAMSITAWLNGISGGAGASGRIADDGKNMFYFTSTGRLYFSSDNGITSTFSADGVVPIATPVHVALTRDVAGAVTFYVNGVISGTADQASGTPGAGINPFCLGNRSAADRSLDGSLGDIRIYSTRLTQSQIRQIIDGTDYLTGLTARWKFGETPRSIPSCAGGYSLEFDGSDDTVRCATEVVGAGARTYAAWVKMDTYGGGTYGRIFDNGKLLFYVGNSGVVLNTLRGSLDGGSNEAVAVAGSMPLDGAWHHVAMSHDAAGTIKLYRDGIPLTLSAPITTTPASGTTVLAIGGRVADNTRNFDGHIDDARIYGVQLSDADVALLAAGGDPTTAPVAHWTLDDGPQYGEPSNGDPISVWESKDGNRWNFTSANHTPAPTYLQSGANGRPGLTFDGVDDYLKCTGWIPNDPYGTIVVVARHTNVANTQNYLASSDEGTSTSYFAVGSVFTTGKARISQRNAADTADSIDSTNGVGTSAVRILSFRSDGSAFAIRMDGVAESLTATSGANTGDWTADTTLRDNVSIGALVSSVITNFFAGTIYEILYFPRPLSDVELRKVERILASKYGITLAG